MRELKFKFLKRSVPIFPGYKEMVRPKERGYVNIEVPFVDKISGLGRIKFLELNTYGTWTMKVLFE